MGQDRVLVKVEFRAAVSLAYPHGVRVEVRLRARMRVRAKVERSTSFWSVLASLIDTRLNRCLINGEG